MNKQANAYEQCEQEHAQFCSEELASEAAQKAQGASEPETAAQQESAQDENSTMLLKAQVAQLSAELAAQRDTYLRQAAEFDNIKKRIERQHASDLEYANSKIIKDLLPVLDALDQAGNFEADDEFSAGLKDGVQNIIRLFAKTLSDYGVEKIAPQLGDAIDPELHEVLMNQHNDALEPGSISMVMQCGYKLKDRVIRAAKVAANN